MAGDKKSGVIDIEHDLVDKREGLTAIAIAENPHVARDEPTKRIQCEMTNGCFNAALVQFLNDPRACARQNLFAPSTSRQQSALRSKARSRTARWKWPDAAQKLIVDLARWIEFVALPGPAA